MNDVIVMAHALRLTLALKTETKVIVLAMRAYEGSRGIAPLFLKLGA
jgi:hypothetical protein